MHVALLQAEGGDGSGLARQGVHGVLIVPVGNDAPALRHQIGKGPEGALHILQVLEKVQMIGLNVQDDGNGGEKREEGVAILAGFQDDGVPGAHPVARPQQGQGAADHHGGVQSRRHDDMGAHGGGGGLAVGPGNTQSVLISLHNGAPCLSPFKDGYPPAPGPPRSQGCCRGRQRYG